MRGASVSWNLELRSSTALVFRRLKIPTALRYVHVRASCACRHVSVCMQRYVHWRAPSYVPARSEVTCNSKRRRPHLTQPDPIHPTRPDPIRSDASRPDPTRAEPSRAEPSRVESSRVGPKRTESRRVIGTPTRRRLAPSHGQSIGFAWWPLAPPEGGSEGSSLIVKVVNISYRHFDNQFYCFSESPVFQSTFILLLCSCTRQISSIILVLWKFSEMFVINRNMLVCLKIK